jgi:cbb3-type cytochrome oxidase maturation protein
MESFYLITPVALILIAIAIKLFLWAVNSGQFDDLDREASRILFDEDVLPPKDAQLLDNDSSAKSASEGTPANGNAP